jgi:glutamine amidotransferase-like uncharacterized protein
VRFYLTRNRSQKRAGGVAHGVGPEFKPQYCKKKKGRKVAKSCRISYKATQKGKIIMKELSKLGLREAKKRRCKV